MSRSGYTDCLESQELNLYRGRVARTIKGKNSQAFLREMARAMDAMPEKVLVADELITDEGDCCAIGTVLKARSVDVSHVDPDCPEQVAEVAGISRTLSAEIEYENDEGGSYNETPDERWRRMRRWTERNID